MKTAVITGATSGIGVALTQECLRQGCQVVALVREKSSNIKRLPSSDQVTVIPLSLSQMADTAHLPCLCTDDSVFYHLGWIGTDRTGRMDPYVQQQNIAFTLDAIRLASRIGCKKFVGAGSQAEYGLHVDRRSGPDSPVFPQTAYGISKYAAGRLGKTLAKQLGIDYFWMRIFSVYGPYDPAGTMINSSLTRMKRREHCAFTQATYDWDYLYSADAGEALYAIGERARGEKVYCLGSGQARPLKEYICEMRDIVAPGLILGFGEISYNEQNQMGMCADISSLERDTEWKPKTDFKSGIRQILEKQE